MVNDKKINEKAMKEVLSHIGSMFDKEHLESPMFNFLIENSRYLDDPEDISIMILHNFERKVEQAIMQINNKSKHIAGLWCDFDFLDSHVTEICSKMYGSGCCADRGRFLVKKWLQYEETGKMPKFDWEQEYTFHYPQSGTMEQWMNFIESVHDLKYGNPTRYLKAFPEILSANEHPEYLKQVEEFEKKNLKNTAERKIK